MKSEIISPAKLKIISCKQVGPRKFTCEIELSPPKLNRFMNPLPGIIKSPEIYKKKDR